MSQAQQLRFDIDAPHQARGGQPHIFSLDHHFADARGGEGRGGGEDRIHLLPNGPEPLPIEPPQALCVDVVGGLDLARLLPATGIGRGA